MAEPVFFDPNAWPPPPDGSDPAPRPALGPAQERVLAWSVGLFLLTSFLAPLAGSSVVHAAVALVRSAMAAR